VHAIDLKTGDGVQRHPEQIPSWVKRVRCGPATIGDVFAVPAAAGHDDLSPPGEEPLRDLQCRVAGPFLTTPRTRPHPEGPTFRVALGIPDGRTVGQTANGPSFALRCRNMSGSIAARLTTNVSG